MSSIGKRIEILKYKGMLSEKNRELDGGGKTYGICKKNRKFLFIDSSN